MGTPSWGLTPAAALDRADAVPQLAANDWQLWTASVQDASPALSLLLDDTERRRLATYRRDHDRQAFLVSAAMLRLAFATATRRPPAQLTVLRSCSWCGGPHGRPRLALRCTDLEASVTYSGDHVLIGLSRFRSGLDIEQMREGLDVASLLCVLSCAEAVAVSGLLGSREAVRAFLTCWVRRESVLKMLGTGLAEDRPIEMTAPDLPPAVLAGPPLLEPEDSYFLYDMQPAPRVVGCLAASRPVRTVTQVNGSAVIDHWRSSLCAGPIPQTGRVYQGVRP
ncbi:MAG: hypothetical protein ABIW17_03800 [Marmoricola sp.]